MRADAIQNGQAILDYLAAHPRSLVADMAKGLGRRVDTLGKMLRWFDGIAVKLEIVSSNWQRERLWSRVEKKLNKRVIRALDVRYRDRIRQRNLIVASRAHAALAKTPAPSAVNNEPWRTVHLMDEAKPYRNQGGQGALSSHLPSRATVAMVEGI